MNTDRKHTLLRERWARLIQEGKCPECQHPLAPGRSRCQSCLDKMKSIYHARRKAGRCIKCGGEAMPGRSLCGYHSEQREDAREQRKAKVAA